MNTLALYVISFLLGASAQPQEILGVDILSAQELKSGIDSGKYNVLLDVRTESEFNNGHIEGATLADSLGLFGTTNEVAVPSALAGCEYCAIAVYCQSGARASAAIKVLQANGFVGRLYNGRGTAIWTEAGFPLVTTESVEPPCLKDMAVQQECSNNVLSYQGGDAVATADEGAGDAEASSGGIVTFFAFGLFTSAVAALL
jgi:rhodanese-related sulfurtransferase